MVPIVKFALPSHPPVVFTCSLRSNVPRARHLGLFGGWRKMQIPCKNAWQCRTQYSTAFTEWIPAPKTPPHYAENITEWCRTSAVLVPRCQSRELTLTVHPSPRREAWAAAYRDIEIGQTKHIQRGEKKKKREKKISISNEHAILLARV